jgi:hypothetical protein
MTNPHPITLSLELVQEIYDRVLSQGVDGVPREGIELLLILEAFTAGADQELDACCDWTRDNDGYDASLELRAARRRALEALPNE